MTTKHTPGPWTILSGTYENGKQFKVVGDESFYAMVGGDKQSMTSGETLANARLVAAAPDLLAALEKAHGLLSDLESDIHEAGKDCPNLYNADFIPGVRNTLLAALAKAKGDG